MPNNKPKPAEYTAKNITSMTPREHIRKRPGMYVGGTDTRALHHLLWEIVDNSLDETMAGQSNHIRIVFHSDTQLSVINNGHGIPVEFSSQAKRSLLEIIMTGIGVGGKFDYENYEVSGGLHGVGVSAINALSSEMIAEVKRDGYLWRQTYSEGLATSPVEQVRPLIENEETGTSITFTPDFTIMDEGLIFEYDLIVERCRELVYLLPQLTFGIEREGNILTLSQSKGLVGWVTDLNQHDGTIHPVLYKMLKTEHTNVHQDRYWTVQVELALQFRKSDDSSVMSFVNTMLVRDGGVQIEGLHESLIKAIYGDNVPQADNPLQGLCAILHIYHPDPQFESCTKVKLFNPEIKTAVAQCVQELFTENPDALATLQAHFTR